jgi:GT2 family glycosyltransferase/Tfp pilus assembly protein PilF
VFAHTRRPFDLVLVDNGSTDGTAEYIRELTARPGPERVTVVTNAQNLGYPAGVNRGLKEAAGEYVVLLNNDTVVSAGWLDGLTAVAAAGWPHAGLVGAVSNFAGGVQQVPVAYESLDGLPRFAAARRLTHRGRVRSAPMLSGFCLLLTRGVVEAVGGLDERFGLGFFDDDDLCRRATAAGFRLTVADGVFVHHFGSRTFLGLGVDTEKQLRDNHAVFRAKWGVIESPTPAAADESPRPPAEPRGTVNPVSLTMIVRDEEQHLAACLDTFRPLVGELVVVDTGSTDRTKEIAARYGARVSDFPWVDDFAAARNEALRHAARPWVLWADADDRIDPANAAKLTALIAGLRDENAAYVLSCECVPDGPGQAATAVDHVRLFRADPRVRWRYRVHEQILPALRSVGADVRWSGVSVQHVGYVDPAVRGRKRERDVRLLRKELADHPDDPFALFNLGAVLHEAADYAAALPVLERSLALSHPKDSIVRKLYALVAQCHARLGQRERAVGVCAAGRGHYPDDAELLFLEGGWRREAGELAAAEHLYRQLVDGREGPHFASVDTSLRGHKGRHNLALAVLAQGRSAEAADLLRQAVNEQPTFLPAWMALAELAARAGDRAECVRIAERMRACGPEGVAEAVRLLAAVGAE